MQFALGAFVNGPQSGPLPFLVNGDFALKPFSTNKIRGSAVDIGTARSLLIHMQPFHVFGYFTRIWIHDIHRILLCLLVPSTLNNASA